MKPFEFVIDRNKWIRGESNSRLLRRSDGKKCCLGFYCLALGLKEYEIIGQGTPLDVYSLILPTDGKWLLKYSLIGPHSKDATELIITNDHKRITDTLREAKIMEIFARHNVNVIFK